ncbi:VOC family protein [uncultured Pseudokineococcus sp.]|uniref:VOC family protein n=1 Tax=uncultured Pseudokineococcus sp. TaxID=1642928 RepID=UPI00261AF40E|nr:VOC family protein [uncultured Pseudokineococcus sp.]
MERVTGIGGFSSGAADPGALGRWCSGHLGVDPAPETYDVSSWWQEAGATVFSAVPAGATHLGGTGRSWSVTFRVADLDAMAAPLREAGVEVVVDGTACPNGRFAELHDPEGDAVQLWQPAGADLHRRT